MNQLLLFISGKEEFFRVHVTAIRELFSEPRIVFAWVDFCGYEGLRK